MFKDVQILKIKEAENLFEQLRNEQIHTRNKAGVLKGELRNLESKLQILESKQNNYKQQNILEEIQNLRDRISLLPFEIAIAEMQANDSVAISKMSTKIKIACSNITDIYKTISLAQLRIKLVDAINLLENNCIAPVLDESDCKIHKRYNKYQSKTNLIAVCETNNMPIGNRLAETNETIIEQTQITLNSEPLECSQQKFRYAVLQPFDQIPRQQIIKVNPDDVRVTDDFMLTQNAWILCPELEVKKVKELNPVVNVLGYKGSKVNEFVAPFVSQLGYRVERLEKNGWVDKQSQQQFNNLLEKENLLMVQRDNIGNYKKLKTLVFVVSKGNVKDEGEITIQ